MIFLLDLDNLCMMVLTHMNVYFRCKSEIMMRILTSIQYYSLKVKKLKVDIDIIQEI